MSSSFKTIIEYRDQVMAALYKASSIYFDDQAGIKGIKLRPESNKKNPTRGLLLTTEPLLFKDGGTFLFLEEIVLIDQVIERPSYKYSFRRNEYYFRYERDFEASIKRDEEGNIIGSRIEHPECHLHANRQTPRFMTHATNFEEVFNFVLANFYET